MIKLGTALLAAAVLLTSAAWAQDAPQNSSQDSPQTSQSNSQPNSQPNSQELPSAPSASQPRFPGAPSQPPQPPQPPAAATPASPAGNATPLTTLPPISVAAPAAAAAQKTDGEQSSGGGQEAPKTGVSAPAPLPVTAPQQGKPEQEDTGLFHIGVQVDLVDLIFTATDKHGHFIKDLKQDDVRLLDEGKPPLHIEAFESETGLPLRVGLLIDASNSIRERFRFEQEAAVEFLHQVVRPKSDLAFVIGFDSIADLTQDYTDNAEALAQGVRVLRPGGGTALHDAIFDACAKLSKAPVHASARRAIILLSDGDDNQSRHTREEAIEAALRAEVIIYVISTSDSDSNRKGDKILMRYAEATGGRVFFPLRLEEVSSAFSEIQDELRSQYVLAYTPQDFKENGSYRAISLDAPKRSNVKIRVRKGYYAPKGKG
jgi:Ca-activated chloride channel homolog